jgi:catechol 2,3-dioxygenase-like lactoylglutathione lyase family enzyme
MEDSMSTTQVRSGGPRAPGTEVVGLRLEVVVIPVGDVDRAKRFYAGLGWRLDADIAADNGFRIVQFTPPGSGCSVQFGDRITTARPGAQFQPSRGQGRAPGRAPGQAGHRSVAAFSDPDGNTWLLQEITTRLAARVDSAAASHESVNDLAAALRRAAAAHGEHEARMGGERDENWPDWYALYMVMERAGEELPT